MANRLSETAPKMIIAATASLAAVGIVYLATNHATAPACAPAPLVTEHVIHYTAPLPPPPPTPIVVEPARPYPAPHK
jgi:hypothetical protein